jgi:hypothetical protein
MTTNARTLNARLNAWLRASEGCAFAKIAAQSLTFRLPVAGDGVLYTFPVAYAAPKPVEGYEQSDFELF